MVCVCELSGGLAMKIFPAGWGRWAKMFFGFGFVVPAVIGLPFGLLPGGFGIPEALGIGLGTGCLAGFIGGIIDGKSR